MSLEFSMWAAFGWFVGTLVLIYVCITATFLYVREVEKLVNKERRK